ncbi:MAG: hypothetical protein EAZ27_00940, partial [Cytophagales bacterium]
QIYPKNTTARTTYFKIGENYENNIGSTHLEMGLTQTTNGEPFIQGNAKHGVPNSFGNLRLQPISGAVTIGETPPLGTNFKLGVDGNVIVKGNIVTKRLYCNATATFPDYVFDDNYKLMSLEETEKFIKINHHLPEFDSGKTYSKDGMDMGKLLILLTKKTEELTLYLIQMKKENEVLKKAIDKLK